MLVELFRDPLSFAVWTFSLLMAITIHEFSHAFVADRLGDPTARLMGRLTLNPLAHLDPLGTLFMLIARFGWGKPVPFDPYNLRNPRRDSALISLAGPVSNILLAIILSITLRVISLLSFSSFAFLFLEAILIPAIILNISLAIFNLIPVHPLDGFKIVTGFLPKKMAYDWQELEGYGLFFLFFLLVPFSGGSLIVNILSPIISTLLRILIPLPGLIV